MEVVAGGGRGVDAEGSGVRVQGFHSAAKGRERSSSRHRFDSGCNVCGFPEGALSKMIPVCANVHAELMNYGAKISNQS